MRGEAERGVGEADQALGEPGCDGASRGYDVVVGGTTVTGTGL